MTNFDIYRLKKAGMSNLLIYQFLTLTADCQEKTFGLLTCLCSPIKYETSCTFLGKISIT
jgi:hypothetical protein